MKRKRGEHLRECFRALNQAYVTRDGTSLSLFYEDGKGRHADRERNAHIPAHLPKLETDEIDGRRPGSSDPPGMHRADALVTWTGGFPVEGIREAAYDRTYDRQRAVAYAEQFWNAQNPVYPYLTVDCTNFVSQCLHAGGIPMLYTGNRGSGWWYRGRNGSWSYSWAVANSLYLLLKSGKPPFLAREVGHPSLLEPGDVICYDFDGDGRWQHNTFVVTKDANGMPLVNAHTTNSRHRYWEYRDSSAYTPRIRYAFFRIRG